MPSDRSMAELGRLGGDAKAARLGEQLASAVASMPALDSEEHAMARLETINRLAVGGVLSGSQAGAAVRSIEVWLKAREAAQDRHRIRELERQVEALEKQLSATRRRNGV